ncbi:phosphotransferase family protein [Oleomonas cavernae]|uniref:Phosphotransferase family protein n=1 Tax=Oleomonas cavernae TaxID=2320859 RepID=A0A418WDY1_9PROT|nr:phosphotransferase [Oleomonas cavernae]RJF88159.1 phosphotransferase family protein [Oleomonas cavernae]
MAAGDQGSEAGAVREAHRFDEGRLAEYLKGAVPGFAGPLTVTQFKGGQSNPTFLLATPARRYVLRKKPPGKLLASAHQIEREYKVIEALAKTDVPVAEAVLLCEDPEVIGTAFYVMGHVDGRVLRDPQLPGMTRDERAAIYDSMNDVMARMHKVDVNAVGLGDFGKPGNYFDRQIGRWSKQYEAAKTDDVAPMDALMAWLPANIPPGDQVTIAHGDYRLENTICHPTQPRILAVLDWELATLGHPLADVAYNCMPYHIADPTMGNLMNVDFAATGIPTEAEYLAAYCQRTGRDGIPSWEFYLAFAMFRLASIAQGVYKRGLDGNASSEKAIMYGAVARFLAELACGTLAKAGVKL